MSERIQAHAGSTQSLPGTPKPQSVSQNGASPPVQGAELDLSAAWDVPGV